MRAGLDATTVRTRLFDVTRARLWSLVGPHAGRTSRRAGTSAVLGPYQMDLPSNRIANTLHNTMGSRNGLAESRCESAECLPLHAKWPGNDYRTVVTWPPATAQLCQLIRRPRLLSTDLPAAGDASLKLQRGVFISANRAAACVRTRADTRRSILLGAAPCVSESELTPTLSLFCSELRWTGLRPSQTQTLDQPSWPGRRGLR